MDIILQLQLQLQATWVFVPNTNENYLLRQFYDARYDNDDVTASFYGRVLVNNPYVDGTATDMPLYIVAITNGDGILFALGIETAYEVWQRCQIAWYLGFDSDPVMIAPVDTYCIEGRMNWHIPLYFRSNANGY